MLTYIVKRMLLAIPTLIGITLVAFILMKNIPGDPALSRAGQRASEGMIARTRKELGFDRPFLSQYGRFLQDISFLQAPVIIRWQVAGAEIPLISFFKRPDLGRSYFTNRSITSLILEKFPNTLRLALSAMILALLLGLFLGILSASYPDSVWDRMASLLAIGGISFPVFWVGLILIMIFSNYLGWLPPSGMGGGSLLFLILPAVTLGSRSAAYLARITRASMLEVSREQYVTTARAKGLSRPRVIFKHIFRNALLPIITLAGLDLGSYLNGSVLTETIYSWDGVGRLAMTAILQRDYPVIIGCVLFGAVIFVAANILVDLSYAYIDPRINYK